MSDEIDWKVVATLIREHRFNELDSETWDQVADKVEALAPKKRGRPKATTWPPGTAKQPKSAIRENYEEICGQYIAFCDCGFSSGEAIAKTVDYIGQKYNVSISPSGVERALKDMRAYFTWCEEESKENELWIKD